MTTPAALPSDWMWCFSADVCKTVPWIIYQGAGNFRAAFVSVPDCDTAKAICDAHNAALSDSERTVAELREQLDYAGKLMDTAIANYTQADDECNALRERAEAAEAELARVKK